MNVLCLLSQWDSVHNKAFLKKSKQKKVKFSSWSLQDKSMKALPWLNPLLLFIMLFCSSVPVLWLSFVLSEYFNF